MSVLVYLLPRESRIAAQERVALLVRRQFFTHVAHRHDEPDDRWAAVSRTGVCPLSVSVHVEHASLQVLENLKKNSNIGELYAPCSDTRTLDRESRLWVG